MTPRPERLPVEESPSNFGSRRAYRRYLEQRRLDEIAYALQRIASAVDSIVVWLADELDARAEARRP